MAKMPFSPCDSATSGSGGDCKDESVKILHDIFGDVIHSLVLGTDPNQVAASSNILATMFSYFNSGILIVGSLIVSYVALVGVANTANDGEAMGKSWSSLWTPVRIVAGGAVLLPTGSGYSFIQIIVLMCSLWGVGFANNIYTAGMSMGLLSPNGIVKGVNEAGQFYGLRDFAKQYMAAVYCAKAANAIYVEQGNKPEVLVQGPDKTVTNSGSREYFYYMKDRNPATNLSGGLPLCGTIKLVYADPKGGEDDTARALDKLRMEVQAVKIEAAVGLMKDIYGWVNKEWPNTINDSGWEGVNSEQLNKYITDRENEIAQRLSGLVNGASGVDSGIKAFIDVLTQEGWATAGGWFQRVGTVRGKISSIMSEGVGEVSKPSLTFLPDDSRKDLLINSVTTVTTAIYDKAGQKASYPGAKNAQLSDLTNAIPQDIKAIDVAKLKSDMESAMSSYSTQLMHNIVSVVIGRGDMGAAAPLCGKAGEMGGSLSRIKCVGDYLVLVNAGINAADVTIKSVVAGLRVIAGVASGGKILGTGLSASEVTVPIWDWVLAVPIHWLDTILGYIEPLAFYFSVFLPSLPYTIFLVVVVGWVLAVLQSAIASSLWAVMHLTPGRTFVGSQTQGYLLLLALFVRPALAVIGLFAAILVADPIIEFTAKGFFGMRDAVVGNTGAVGVLSGWFTFSWWMIVFGLTLLPIIYMCFGLPQILPDHVLRWIGAGVSDLGETNAIGQMRGQMTALSVASAASGGGGGGGGGGTLAAAYDGVRVKRGINLSGRIGNGNGGGDSGGSGGGDSGGRGGIVSANAQGIAPGDSGGYGSSGGGNTPTLGRSSGDAASSGSGGSGSGGMIGSSGGVTPYRESGNSGGAKDEKL